MSGLAREDLAAKRRYVLVPAYRQIALIESLRAQRLMAIAASSKGLGQGRRSKMSLDRQRVAAVTLASSFVLACIGFGALHAQTKISPAFWVTETLEVSDQAAFLNVIKAVPATLQPFGGQYVVLGGKIAPGEGSPPRRITIVAFDSLEKAQRWFNSPAATAARAEAQKFAKIRSYFVEGVAK